MFAQVRELAHTFMFDFHDAVVKLDGALPARKLLVETGVQYLNGLHNEEFAGEMADGNYWQRVVARESIKALGGQDYCGLIHWDWNAAGVANCGNSWLWRTDGGRGMIRVRGNR